MNAPKLAVGVLLLFSVASAASHAEPADGGTADHVPVNEVGAFSEICDKLVVKCKDTFFDNIDDCKTAAEASIDDPVSAKTYRCIALANTCTAVTKCMPAKPKRKRTKKK